MWGVDVMMIPMLPPWLTLPNPEAPLPNPESESVHEAACVGSCCRFHADPERPSSITRAQIPTFHAIPLHPECDKWCDFPVADRPNAVAQWVSYVKANPSEIKVWALMEVWSALARSFCV